MFCMHRNNIQLFQSKHSQEALVSIGYSQNFRATILQVNEKINWHLLSKSNSVYENGESNKPLYFSLIYFDRKRRTLPKQASASPVFIYLDEIASLLCSPHKKRIKNPRKNIKGNNYTLVWPIFETRNAQVI